MWKFSKQLVTLLEKTCKAYFRWETSVGNVEEARVTFDVIARAIEDAVYLDEDAYREIAPTMQFTKVIRVIPILAHVYSHSSHERR